MISITRQVVAQGSSSCGGLLVQPFSSSPINISSIRLRPILTFSPTSRRSRRFRISAAAEAAAAEAVMVRPEQPGGRMVTELVGAFNHLTSTTSSSLSTTSCSSHQLLLFNSLKLSIPLLYLLPLSPDGHSPLSKALSLALLLTHLQMDAEVISAGILREVVEAGVLSIHEVRTQIGTGTAHLLHESFRVKNMTSKVDVLDDDTAAALRKYCLTFYDVRAVILDLAVKLDTMRHLDYLPRYQQLAFSLEVMKIHAPLAHAIGTVSLSLELEDLSFRYLFPCSYLCVDTWLRSHDTGSKPLIDTYKEHLLQCLNSDPLLGEMVDDISIKGRYKSHYSTMKKLLKDGRKPEDVNDIFGLRVVLKPVSGDNVSEVGEKACYRAREVIRCLWKEIPKRSKDYIARPKANGYRSLHMSVDVSDNGRSRPLMEIQIRTTEMDITAGGGIASHSLYKGGLTDPEEAKRLKAIMTAAAELAATRLKDLSLTNQKGGIEIGHRDRVFLLLDKNGDGKICVEELMEVMEELGAKGEDAREMMQLLDANGDGSLSSDEFDMFQKQVELMRNLEDKDHEYKALLNKNLAVAEHGSFIQLYRKELGEGLAVS